MAIRKPGWLESGLSWLNIRRGDWISEWFFQIPPFDFRPGEWIEAAIDWLLGAIGWLTEHLILALNTASDALAAAWKALGLIDNWVLGAARWLSAQLSDWWSSTFQQVKDWVWTVVGALATSVNHLWRWMLEADSWLAGKLDPVFSWVTGLLRNYTPLALFRDLGQAVGPILDFWLREGKRLVELMSMPLEWSVHSVIEPLLKDVVQGFTREMEK